jgi:hypothetical protein
LEFLVVLGLVLLLAQFEHPAVQALLLDVLKGIAVALAGIIGIRLVYWFLQAPAEAYPCTKERWDEISHAIVGGVAIGLLLWLLSPRADVKVPLLPRRADPAKHEQMTPVLPRTREAFDDTRNARLSNTTGPIPNQDQESWFS